ncbi:hypothetical protein PUN28_017618 [Cardiocondyla obscurior]|uniref:Uncharacterized protein n=1 Tax=Cardiocondyla obscurior TaxID=286306 RepID=A0AAW2EJW9_9HYME
MPPPFVSRDAPTKRSRSRRLLLRCGMQRSGNVNSRMIASRIGRQSGFVAHPGNSIVGGEKKRLDSTCHASFSKKLKCRTPISDDPAGVPSLSGHAN